MVGQRIARGRWTLLLALFGCDRGEPAAVERAEVAAPPSLPDASARIDAAIAEIAAPVADVGIDDAIDVAPPLPAVRVVNIGMHIGGGPNDDVTKAPIAQSVAPHFDELRACFALLDAPLQVELGVDLTIEAAGGKAKVTHPRSTAPGTKLRDCGVRVFESIDFLPPKTGKTIVSYSVQFTPTKP